MKFIRRLQQQSVVLQYQRLTVRWNGTTGSSLSTDSRNSLLRTCPFICSITQQERQQHHRQRRRQEHRQYIHHLRHYNDHNYDRFSPRTRTLQQQSTFTTSTVTSTNTSDDIDTAKDTSSASESTQSHAATTSTTSTTTSTIDIAKPSIPPTLTLWKQMIQTIPLQQILPIGMKKMNMNKMMSPQPHNHQPPPSPQSNEDVANRAAFYGDKILNYYIAQTIRQQHQPKQQQQQHQPKQSSSPLASFVQDDIVVENQLLTAHPPSSHNNKYDIMSSYSGIDLGYINLVQGTAMSNQLYAQLLTDIMGTHPHITTEMIQQVQEQQQIHDAGTMIEATVDAIMNPLPSSSSSSSQENASTTTTYTKQDAIAAVQELAAYLVYHAYTTTTYFNAKGQLLELGGTVISYPTEDSVPTLPKFRAIATLSGMSYLSDPPSSTKKMAEQIAATHLLQKCQHLRPQPVSKQRITFANNNPTIESDVSTSSSSSLSLLSSSSSLTADSIDIVTFNADLMDDGTLPDDFYSDIATIAKRTSLKNSNEDEDDDDDDDDDMDRPFDAQRFQLPKLQKRAQCDFHHFNNTHTVNLRDDESPEMSWRRGAYDKRSCFHRAILAAKMLPHHVETVNSWTRPYSNKELFTVVVVLVPKRKPEDTSIFPNVKCFVRHDTSRNRARNALGLVVNQYIDQVIIGSDISEIQASQQHIVPKQPDRKLWPPQEVHTKERQRKKRETKDVHKGKYDHPMDDDTDHHDVSYSNNSIRSSSSSSSSSKRAVPKEYDSWYDCSNEHEHQENDDDRYATDMEDHHNDTNKHQTLTSSAPMHSHE